MKKTILEIIEKYNSIDIFTVVLDYEGDIEEFASLWDLPDDVLNDEATSRYNNGVLTLIVRG